MRYTICFIVLFASVFLGNAQNFLIKDYSYYMGDPSEYMSEVSLIRIKDDSYYVGDPGYFLTTIKLTNITKDTLIMWFADTCVLEDTMTSIRDHFFHAKVGAFILGQLIYDSNVSSIGSMDVRSAFIKELPPKDSFDIIFFDTLKVTKDQSLEFFQNHVVLVKKDMLSSFYFTSMPTWLMLLYKNDFIVLPKRMLTY